jgi:hypothetical protein
MIASQLLKGKTNEARKKTKIGILKRETLALEQVI